MQRLAVVGIVMNSRAQCIRCVTYLKSSLLQMNEGALKYMVPYLRIVRVTYQN